MGMEPQKKTNKNAQEAQYLLTRNTKAPNALKAPENPSPESLVKSLTPYKPKTDPYRTLIEPLKNPRSEAVARQTNWHGPVQRLERVRVAILSRGIRRFRVLVGV